MNSFAVFQTLFDQLETPFLAGVSALVLAFANYARPPIQAALVLYVALVGYQLMTGHGGSAGAVMKHALKLAIVVWFATDATAYTTWVQNFFMSQLPGDLNRAGFVGGSTT